MKLRWFGQLKLVERELESKWKAGVTIKCRIVSALRSAVQTQTEASDSTQRPLPIRLSLKGVDVCRPCSRLTSTSIRISCVQCAYLTDSCSKSSNLISIYFSFRFIIVISSKLSLSLVSFFIVSWLVSLIFDIFKNIMELICFREVF